MLFMFVKLEIIELGRMVSGKGIKSKQKSRVLAVWEWLGLRTEMSVCLFGLVIYFIRSFYEVNNNMNMNE